MPLSDCEPRGPVHRQAHLGIYPQSQSQLYYIGISIPVGQLPVEKMRAIADIADRFGSGELRLTVWQNLIIPNIAEDKLEDVKDSILAADLNYEAGTVLSRILRYHRQLPAAALRTARAQPTDTPRRLHL